jgi:hypothetical protein
MINFATPVIWHPLLEDEEISDSIDAMIDRALYTEQWLQGAVSTSDYLDYVDADGIDVFDLVEGWERGEVNL